MRIESRKAFEKKNKKGMCGLSGMKVEKGLMQRYWMWVPGRIARQVKLKKFNRIGV